MTYRLGLDIGANSIGWCCLKLGGQTRPAGVLDVGVRIFPDGRNPKDGSSLAAARRQPRSVRRNRDRYAHHSDQRTGEVRERLPYYGELLFERIGTGTGKLDDASEKRWGRAPNPTVHVALNEVRRVVNALIDKHGTPTEIVIETLRDLGRSAVQKREAEREQKKNQDANDNRRKLLTEMALPVKDNLIRLRLWEEQAVDPNSASAPTRAG
jgi:CRISPR/Cas system Type II protein with McrA/HNH and RuvC-like nuclease domain